MSVMDFYFERNLIYKDNDVTMENFKEWSQWLQNKGIIGVLVSQIS